MKQLGTFFARLGRLLMRQGVAGAIAAALLVYRLTDLAPRLTSNEQYTLAASHTLQGGLLANPLSLPLQLLQRIAELGPHTHTIFFDRLPSALLALTAFFIFLYITKRWYGQRSMLLGTILFVTSAWFLHVGRFAGVDIMYLTAILALLAVHVGLHDHEDRPFMFYGWLVVNLFLLTVPGLVWPIIFSALCQPRTILHAWRHLGSIWNRVGWSLLAAAGIGTLAYVLAAHTTLVHAWLGLPEHLLPVRETLWHIGQAFDALIYRAPFNPELWVGRLPLLDIFASAMLLMGLVFYIRHWQAQRTHLLFAYVIFGAILVGFGGPVTMSILLPIVYLIATAGTAYTLHFWLRLFPRNPVARSFGIGLMGCLVMLAAFYNLKLYYQVWPHNPDTQAIESRR